MTEFNGMLSSRFFRFALSGAGSLFVTLALTWFLTDVLGFYYLFSYILVLFTVTVMNYILAVKFVFMTRKRSGSRFIIYLLGLLVFYFGDVFFTRYLTEVLLLYYLVSALISRVVFFIVKYIYYRNLLFNDGSFLYRGR